MVRYMDGLYVKMSKCIDNSNNDWIVNLTLFWIIIIIIIELRQYVEFEYFMRFPICIFIGWATTATTATTAKKYR